MSKRKSTHDAGPSADTTRRRSSRLMSSTNSTQDAAQVNGAPAKPQPKQEIKQHRKPARDSTVNTAALPEEKSTVSLEA